MADNKQYINQAQENGSIMISEDVISTIVSHAVSEVEGVYGLSSSFTADLAQLLGKKNMSKGVKLSIEENVVSVECFVVINYGVEIPAVAANIQDSVMNAVESMTGLKVAAVDVDICGISAPKE